MTELERLSVETDSRGESEDYERFTLVQRNEYGHVVTSEGIRKDRTAMHLEIRAWLEPILARLKADLQGHG